MSSVLVLNASLEPLSRTRMSRAISLLESGKAVLHRVHEDKILRHPGGEMLWPVAIRLVTYLRVKVSRAPAQWSRRGVLIRDGYQCALQVPGVCTKVATTVDHVLPVSRGGTSIWLNSVAACFSCNNYKDDRTPEEADIDLSFAPWVPTKAQLSALS